MFLKPVIFSLLALTTSAGQCSESESSLWINNYGFTEKIKSCAIQNMGSGDGTAKCLVGHFSGLSDSCASCFGQTVECGKKNCQKFCLADSAAPACLECTEKAGCNAALNTCTGFSQGPPAPTQAPGANPKSGSTDGNSASGIGAGTTVAMMAFVMISLL